MLASLPMYDLPELAQATAAWWAGLARWFRRQGLEDVPSRLASSNDCHAHWMAPDLLLSQTCGYPLTHEFAGHVRVVATPVYAAEGCAGAEYSSVIVVREDARVAAFPDLRGVTAAINGPTSHSGCNALRRMAAPLQVAGRFFGRTIITGAHFASMAAVAAGKAEIAAIDCVTFALMKRERPEAAAGLRVLCLSEPAPGLPYITAGGAGDDRLSRLRQGLREAAADPELESCRASLLLTGFEELPPGAYDRIAAMEREAEDMGCAPLA